MEQGKRSRKEKMNIPMCLACVLFCLTLITTHMTGGLFAKYATHAEGSDSARVAAFNKVVISEEGDFGTDGSEEALIIPGVDLTKKAVVNFEKSEVATYIFVAADLSGNWTGTDASSNSIDGIDTFSVLSEDKNTAYLQWVIADGWKYLKKIENQYVYYRELEPLTELKDVDIVDDGKITVSSQIPTIPQADFMALDATHIKFRAIAVQAGGFNSAEAAWNSVKDK